MKLLPPVLNGAGVWSAISTLGSAISHLALEQCTRGFQGITELQAEFSQYSEQVGADIVLKSKLIKTEHHRNYNNFNKNTYVDKMLDERTDWPEQQNHNTQKFIGVCIYTHMYLIECRMKFIAASPVFASYPFQSGSSLDSGFIELLLEGCASCSFALSKQLFVLGVAGQFVFTSSSTCAASIEDLNGRFLRLCFVGVRIDDILQLFDINFDVGATEIKGLRVASVIGDKLKLFLLCNGKRTGLKEDLPDLLVTITGDSETVEDGEAERLRQFFNQRSGVISPIPLLAASNPCSLS
uniref:Uncharacterized protein n=1 Tax=Glossina palpalis gambiensis TaxID=67801 RepID=A0A1B0BUF2_9MUSC